MEVRLRCFKYIHESKCKLDNDAQEAISKAEEVLVQEVELQL